MNLIECGLIAGRNGSNEQLIQIVPGGGPDTGTPFPGGAFPT